MDKFLETSFYFDVSDQTLHAKIFTISKRQAFGMADELGPILQRGVPPEDQFDAAVAGKPKIDPREWKQKKIAELVEKIHPELTGCRVWAMVFDIFRQEWQIGVMHPSLPKMVFGERIPDENLFENASHKPAKEPEPQEESWRDREPLL